VLEPPAPADEVGAPAPASQFDRLFVSDGG